MKTILKSIIAWSMVATFACKGNTQDERLAMTEPLVVAPVAPQATIQIALLLDTSNSMDGLIQQAKTQLWNLVNKMSYAHCNEQQALIEIALYEYGNSTLKSEEGYIKQIAPFTTDLDLIGKELFALDTQGGDEYCGMVIGLAANHLEWRTGNQDLKMIFIAGNESFLQGNFSVNEAMGLAAQKDITVNTIFCGDLQTGISLKWKNGADLGKGAYTVIDQNQQTQYVATPYDDEILEYNTKLNQTYIAYGREGKDKLERQASNDMELEKISLSANVERSVVKSKAVYNNASWDLIDAAKDEKELETIIKKNKSTLPAELEEKSVAEIVTYAKEKKKEREEIQACILSLNTKREAFIKQESKGDNELESAMEQAIRKKAATKNYTWK